MTFRQYRILKIASKKYYDYDILDNYDKLEDEIEFIAKKLRIKSEIVEVEINNLKKIGYYSINYKHISFEADTPTANVTIEGFVACCDYVKNMIFTILKNIIIPAIVSIVVSIIVA